MVLFTSHGVDSKQHVIYFGAIASNMDIILLNHE